MSALTDFQIVKLADNGMISPFVRERTQDTRPDGTPGLSYGCESATYTMRLHPTVYMPVEDGRTAEPGGKIEERFLPWDTEGSPFVLAPGRSFLAQSVETFDIPPDVLAHIWTKSSYSRWFVGVFDAAVDPGFRGKLRLAVVNAGPWAVHIYPNEGIASIGFWQMSGSVRKGYAGRYQEKKPGLITDTELDRTLGRPMGNY